MNQWLSGIKILLYLVCAMLLDMLTPLWGTLGWLSPPWVFVFLLLFTIYYPHLLNIGLAWLLGLFVDVWAGQPLGQNALLFSCSVFLIHFSFKGLTQITIAYKIICISIMLFLYRIIPIVTNDHFLSLWQTWLPSAFGGALSGAFIWYVFALFKEKRYASV